MKVKTIILTQLSVIALSIIVFAYHVLFLSSSNDSTLLFVSVILASLMTVGLLTFLYRFTTDSIPYSKEKITGSDEFISAISSKISKKTCSGISFIIERSDNLFICSGGLRNSNRYIALTDTLIRSLKSEDLDALILHEIYSVLNNQPVKVKLIESIFLPLKVIFSRVSSTLASLVAIMPNRKSASLVETLMVGICTFLLFTIIRKAIYKTESHIISRIKQKEFINADILAVADFGDENEYFSRIESANRVIYWAELSEIAEQKSRTFQDGTPVLDVRIKAFHALAA